MVVMWVAFCVRVPAYEWCGNRCRGSAVCRGLEGAPCEQGDVFGAA